MIKTPNGATVTLNGGGIRAILRSPTFDLAYPSILTITLSQSTFGSRVLLCPDDTSDPTLCHELAGPRVLDSSEKQVCFRGYCSYISIGFWPSLANFRLM